MSGGSKKKSGNKKPKTEPVETSNERNSLERPLDNHTINPRSILTGFYQKNGKRVQHIVHDGALQMPREALDVIARATQTLTDNPPTATRKYQLPGLDSVVRPSLDPKLETMVVTELVMEKVQIPQQEQPPGLGPDFQPLPPVIKMIKTSRPSAKNKIIKRVLAVAADNNNNNKTAAERIRGGGDDEPMDNPQSSVPPPAPVPAAAAQVAMAPPPQETSAMETEATPDVAVATPVESAATTMNVTSDNTTAAVAPDVQPPADTVPATSPPQPPASSIPPTPNETKPMEVPTQQSPCPAPVVAPAPVTTQQSPAPMPADAPAPASALPSDNTGAAATTGSLVVPTTSNPAPAQSVPSSSTPVTKPAEKPSVAPAAAAPVVPVAAAPVVPKPVVADKKDISAIKPSVTPVAPAPAPVVPTVADKKDISAIKPSVVPVAAAPVVPKPVVADKKDISAIKPSVPPVTAAPVVPKPVVADKKDISAIKTESSSTSAIPAVASSSTPKPATSPQVKQEEKKPTQVVPEAKALPSKPAPQWEQHKPGPNDETITPENQLPPKPEWYKTESINEVERSMLPEWFDASAAHRTPESYLQAREKIIAMSEALSNRNVTNAMIRRSILGDAGSLQRLRKFLVNWGIINRDGINDSAPTTASLRPSVKRSAIFTNDMRESLLVAVTEQASKKRKLAGASTSAGLSLDWEEIAQTVGYGVSGEKCRENFMTAPLQQEDANAMDVSDDAGEATNSSEQFVQDLVAKSNPQVVQKVFDVALEATDSLEETKAASLLGLQLTQALENARGHEVDLAVRLSKLLDARMQKLENRMAMMDDVEGILEAEKVALEMERRDLYTARCRHWFGGV